MGSLVVGTMGGDKMKRDSLKLGKHSEILVAGMETQLRRRQITGSATCAKKTAEALRMVMSKEQRSNVALTIDLVRYVGRRLNRCSAIEFAIGNIVRRVLHIIREEAQNVYRTMKKTSMGVGDDDDFEFYSRRGGGGGEGYGGKMSRVLSSGTLDDGMQLDAVEADTTRTRTVSLHTLIETGVSISGAKRTSMPAIHEHTDAGAADDVDASRGGRADGASAAARSPAAAGGGGGGARGARGQAEGEIDVGLGFILASQKECKEFMRNLRTRVIEQINELIDEVDTMEGLIAEQASEHIHAEEVILTSGDSRSVFEFLREAAKKRTFQVIVAESLPNREGHNLARKLAEIKVQTMIIPDAAVFAMMSRVNMVLNGAHAVLANGGVVTRAGVSAIAQAAAHHSVPFIVLTGLYKLSPLYPHDQATTINEFQSPADLVEYRELEECLHTLADEGEAGSFDVDAVGAPVAVDVAEDAPAAAEAGGAGPGLEKESARSLEDRIQEARKRAQRRVSTSHPLEISNYAFDYVPPHLIKIFVTDMGGNAPSYIYRLLTEYYDMEDKVL